MLSILASDLPQLSAADWLWAILGALCIGVAKSGFAGVGLATVVIMSHLFPPRESTGILLPLLICGDVCSVLAFRQHAQWAQIRRMLPCTLAGVVLGFAVMGYIPDRRFSPVIGWIVLAMTVLQFIRRVRPVFFQRVPHTRAFAWSMGTTSGVTTMLANAAGPVMALYFNAIELPKLEFVGTSGWFFLIVNVFKVPFSAQLGLIHGGSLLFNLLLAPFVVFGILAGRKLLLLISQEWFEILVLFFTSAAALRLLLGN